jgi:putative oxidoreductase
VSSSKYQTIALTLLRAVAALILMQHGAQKLFGVLGGFGGRAGATAPLFSLMGLAGVLELFVALLVLLGLFTRPAALLLAGEMAIAYFKTHAPRGFWPVLNKGELAVILAFVFLLFAVVGGGRFSLDRLLFRGAERAGAEGR